MGHSRTYYDLLDAFHEEGCPICRVSQTGVYQYMDSLAYECVNLGSVRAEFRAAGGFCRQHARQWLERPRLLGTAILYQDILLSMAAALREGQSRRPSGFERLRGRLRCLVQPSTSVGPGCPACRVLEDEERHGIDCLLQHLVEWDFEEAYEQSSGLCWLHLQSALDASADESIHQLLVEVATCRSTKLAERLGYIIQRHDPRLMIEPLPDEASDVRRAIESMSGADLHYSELGFLDHPPTISKARSDRFTAHHWGAPAGRRR